MFPSIVSIGFIDCVPQPVTENAVKDSTYIYLSNKEDITFEQAWKASGLSSNMDDYFDIDEAVLVELPD